MQNAKKRYSIGCMMLLSAVFVALTGILAHNSTAYAWPVPSTTVLVCNVKTFGAVGNGKLKDTLAIQNAINTCANQGGGSVLFPPGTYLSAPLFLKSNITLQVSKGATLIASKDAQDYVVPPGVQITTTVLPFIYAYQVDNVSVTGGGIIDGNGSAWWSKGLIANKRPRLFVFAYSTNINISYITLQNAGSTHVRLYYVTNATVQYVTVKSPASSPNTDGIDPATSHNVLIEYCVIDTGDDNVAIKSGFIEPGYPNAGSSNIQVLHNQFLHGHGVSIGSETNGGVQNVLVEDNTFQGTENGIRVKSTRSNGGDVSGLVYRHNTMTNVKYALIISGYYPDIPADGDPAQPVTATTPYFHNILIDDLTVTGATFAGYVIGVTEKPFTNITLNNVHITAKTGLQVRNTTLLICATTITVSSGSSYLIESHTSIQPCSAN